MRIAMLVNMPWVFLAATTAAAQPPGFVPMFPPPAAVVVQPAADPPSALKWMGRVKPVQSTDVGKYRAVKGTDGKVRYFPRLGQFADFSKLAASLPAKVDWSEKAKAALKRMYLNDRYGCCVISSKAHRLGFHSGSDTPAGPGLEATDAEILAAYKGICGPGDNGCNMSAVLQYQQRYGLTFGGQKRIIRGSISVDNTNKDLVKAALYLFGGLDMGFSLPNSWLNTPDGSTWDVTNSGIVGGHEVQVYGYTDAGVLLSTWGGWRTMTWAAFTSGRWVDETYAVIAPEWYGKDNLAPNGVDVGGLEKAFDDIANGIVPVLPDDPPQPPQPPVDPPRPPVPGKGFTGTIAVVTTYKDGVQVGPPITQVGNSAADLTVEDDLKAAGVNPVVIADVLKLLKDIRTKAGREVIMADILKLILDLGLSFEEKTTTPPACCGGDPMSALWRREDYASLAV